jgi:hypothetical protein
MQTAEMSCVVGGNEHRGRAAAGRARRFLPALRRPRVWRGAGSGPGTRQCSDEHQPKSGCDGKRGQSLHSRLDPSDSRSATFLRRQRARSWEPDRAAQGERLTRWRGSRGGWHPDGAAPRWRGAYPEPYNGAAISTQQFLVHLLSHLNYHLGQIDYLRRFTSGAGTIELATL